MKSENLIKKNLFDLTPEQVEVSKMMYGKVIKCLIAPYHNIKNIPLEPNDEVYVFPERDLNIQQRKEIVSIMANSNKDEIRFVTSDVFIIRDMIDGCTRILTPDGELEETPEKTFAANHHTVLLEVLANEYHIKNKKDENEKMMKVIQKVIDDINKKVMTQEEYDRTKKIIETIGEEIISRKLSEMLYDVRIISTEYKKDKFTGVVEFTKEEVEFLKGRKWFKDNLTIKECIKECRQGQLADQEQLKLYDQLIELKKRTKDDIEEDKKNKERVSAEIKMRHKIEYWLTEQNEKKKIKDVFNS